MAPLYQLCLTDHRNELEKVLDNYSRFLKRRQIWFGLAPVVPHYSCHFSLANAGM